MPRIESQRSQGSQGSGNNETDPFRSRAYAVTINNPTPQDIARWIILGDQPGVLKIIGSIEIAPTTGTRHIQGFVRFRNQKLRRVLMAFMRRQFNASGARGSDKQNYVYCTKENVPFVCKGFQEEVTENYTFALAEPYPWQSEVIELAEGRADDRSVYWIWEDEGNVGKTALQKHLVMNHGAIMLSGKGADMKYGVSMYIQKQKKYPTLILINIPRSVDNKYVSFTGIEEVKDMMFFSGKYETSMVCGPNPHVICFANRSPPIDELSGDRWRIAEVINRQLQWEYEGEQDGTVASFNYVQ